MSPFNDFVIEQFVEGRTAEEILQRAHEKFKTDSKDIRMMHVDRAITNFSKNLIKHSSDMVKS